MNNKLSIAGLLYGLVVHFKLYPIIYLPAFYLALTKSNKVWKAFKPNAKKFKFVTFSALVLFYRLIGRTFVTGSCIWTRAGYITSTAKTLNTTLALISISIT
jgi:hypothetical protein